MQTFVAELSIETLDAAVLNLKAQMNCALPLRR